MDQFVDLCILSGCDYCDSIRGIWILYSIYVLLPPTDVDAQVLLCCSNFICSERRALMHLLHRYRGTDCFKAYPSTWVYRKYTREHQ